MEVIYFALMKSISNEVTGSCNNLRLNLWQIWTISGHSQTNLNKIEKEKKMIGRSREVGSETETEPVAVKTLPKSFRLHHNKTHR